MYMNMMSSRVIFPEYSYRKYISTKAYQNI